MESGSSKLCGAEAGVKAMRVAALFVQRVVRRAAKLFGVFGHEVGQVATFGVVPELFYRVKFRGISRQPLHLQPSSVVLLEQTNGFAMHAPSIQHDDQWPSQ